MVAIVPFSKVTPTGSKGLRELSKGTQFQLYLALRLAGYFEFARRSPTVPFISDDIMETFASLRSREVFSLFAKTAEVGQVIYLTHHEHLCDLAREACPSVQIHPINDRAEQILARVMNNNDFARAAPPSAT